MANQGHPSSQGEPYAGKGKRLTCWPSNVDTSSLGNKQASIRRRRIWGENLPTPIDEGEIGPEGGEIGPLGDADIQRTRSDETWLLVPADHVNGGPGSSSKPRPFSAEPRSSGPRLDRERAPRQRGAYASDSARRLATQPPRPRRAAVSGDAPRETRTGSSGFAEVVNAALVHGENHPLGPFGCSISHQRRAVAPPPADRQAPTLHANETPQLGLTSCNTGDEPFRRLLSSPPSAPTKPPGKRRGSICLEGNRPGGGQRASISPVRKGEGVAEAHRKSGVQGGGVLGCSGRRKSVAW